MKKIGKIVLYFIVALIILFIGVGIGSSGKSAEPQEKIVEKEVAKCPDEANWKELKMTDDQVIKLASENFYAVSEALTALSNLDFDTASKKTAEIETNNDKMEPLAAKRQEILDKLGY